MKTSLSLALVTVLLVVAALVVGCSGTNSPPSGDWKKGLDSKVVDGLSKLSETDRAAALKQKVCPVTGKQLGSMGKPPKVTVKGQDVFLCCAGCEGDLTSDPDKYLAKLKAN